MSGDKDTSQGTLTDASTGYAPTDLAGDSLISGKTTYVFKDNGKVVVRSPNGSSESVYAYLKTGENEGVLSVSAVFSTFYTLSYSSTGAGTFSEGSTASFDYFADMADMPAAKGWMWLDQYPWVYSHREGGWLYFVPSNGKINAYSAQDKAWRELSASKQGGLRKAEVGPPAYSNLRKTRVALCPPNPELLLMATGIEVSLA